MLTDRTFWAVAPSSFNDPLDCIILMDYEVLSDETERTIYVDRIILRSRAFLESKGLDPEDGRVRLLAELSTLEGGAKVQADRIASFAKE